MAGFSEFVNSFFQGRLENTMTIVLKSEGPYNTFLFLGTLALGVTCIYMCVTLMR